MTTKKLTLKQKRFIEAYLETGNLTEAARRAGYGGNDEALANIGYQNYRKLEIRRRIDARIADSNVSADEVIGTLASQMRADVTEIFTDAGGFDLETIRQRGLGHLIKKVKVKREWEGKDDDLTPVDVIEIELHSSQAAAVQLSKILGIEKEPAPNEETKRREIVRRMLEKAMLTGMNEAEAKSALMLMGVDAADLESVSNATA